MNLNEAIIDRIKNDNIGRMIMKKRKKRRKRTMKDDEPEKEKDEEVCFVKLEDRIREKQQMIVGDTWTLCQNKLRSGKQKDKKKEDDDEVDSKKEYVKLKEKREIEKKERWRKVDGVFMFVCPLNGHGKNKQKGERACAPKLTFCCRK